MLETLGLTISEYWNLYGIRVLQTLVTIAIVLLGGNILHAVGVRLTRRVLKPRVGAKDYAVRLRSAQTLIPLLLDVERYVIYFMVTVMILAQFGIDTGAILASVGVVGIAVGFGAQNLVKDVISGFFLLFDGLLAVGDVVRIDKDTAGTVEAISLRNTHLRDFTGLLWIIPNGDLRMFGNFNRGWMRAVVIVDIARESDFTEAQTAMLDVAAGWVAENAEKVLEPPEVQGLLAFGEASMQMRLVIKMEAMQQWAAERELRKRLKDAFDQRGIEIPYPRRVLISPKKDEAA